MHLLLLTTLWLGVLAGTPAPAAPEIVSLKVTPAVIHPGDEVTVSWVTHYTDSVSVDWRSIIGPRRELEHRGGLSPTGSFSIRLNESTIFILSCENKAGSCARSITANVKVRR